MSAIEVIGTAEYLGRGSASGQLAGGHRALCNCPTFLGAFPPRPRPRPRVFVRIHPTWDSPAKSGHGDAGRQESEEGYEFEGIESCGVYDCAPDF